MKYGRVLCILSILWRAVVSEEIESDTLHQSIIESNSRFSDSLYSILKDGDQENLIYSPLGVITALTTLLAGADGRTAKEIKKGLRLSEINETFACEQHSILLKSLQENENITVKLTEALYIAKGFELSESFNKTIHEKFSGDVVSVDFSRKDKVVAEINKMVVDSTNGLQSFYSKDYLENSTTAILVTTVYFKAEWERGFTPLLTQKRPFFTVDGQKLEVDTMIRGADYPYAEIMELNSTVLSIPYKGNRFSLNIILPEREIKLSDLEEGLESFPISSIIPRLEMKYIQLSLPKFSLNSTVDFVTSEALEKLGMNLLLSSEADFSKISSSPGLRIQSVIQNTFLKVNEGGTEAARTNFIEAVPASFRFLTPFTVDRPFIAFVYDNVTESVLFIGRKLR